MPKPPSTGPVTANGKFGWRNHPITGERKFHAGEDRTGSGNDSPVNGTVIFAGWDNSGAGFGNAVAIKQDGADVVWWIAHFATISTSVGKKVTEGQKIGTIGKTGAATGIHTHTERRENGNASPRSGIATNPSDYYTNTSGGGSTPIEEEEEMNNAVLLRLPNGSVAFWDGPHFVPLTSTDQVAALAAANLVPNTNGTPQYMQLADGFIWNLAKSIADGASTGFTAADRASIADLPTNGELGQALTSTVSLVNAHADTNKDAIIAAIPGGTSAPSGSFDLSLTIDEIPGTATGTATPA